MMDISLLLEGKISFDEYCEEITSFLQTSNEINVRFTVAYLQNALEGNAEILNRLCDYVTQYSSSLEEENNRMREHMRDKIPEYYHDSFMNTEKDILIHEPLERQINGMPVFDEGTQIAKLFYNAVKIRYHMRKLYSYFAYYVDKITVDMQYLKSQILNLELSRYRSPQIVLQPIDCVIEFHMHEYVKLNRLFKHYHGKMCKINVDGEFLYHRHSSADVYVVMYQYYKYIFNRQYGLPKSVIDEANKNPQIKYLVMPPPLHFGFCGHVK